MKCKRNRIKLFVDRALSESLLRQVGILAAVLVIALIISFVCLSFSGYEWRRFCTDNDLSPWLLPIYLLIDSNALNNLYIDGHVHGWMLMTCSITYLIGILVFHGMIIGVITNLIDHRVQAHRNGLLHYAKSGHYIVMGYDDMVPSIIHDIFMRAKDEKVDVLLLTSVDANVVREKLQRSVARDKMGQIFVTYGHRMVKDDYADIHLETAEEIFIVGNRTRPAHDAINVECVDSIRTYLTENQFQQRPKRITCVFEDLDTYAAFKTTEIFREISNLNIEFVPYNFYAGWAQQLFVNRSYHEKNNPDQDLKYPLVCGNGITPEDHKHVHLVFVGTSNFADTLAMEAAHVFHFPNFENDNSRRTRITFIERNADEELKLFATRNRHFFEVQPYLYKENASVEDSEAVETKMLAQDLESHNFLDVEFEFIKGDVFSSEIQGLFKRWAADENQYLSIFLTSDNQRSNFVMGMNMPDEIYDNAIPVFIRQDRADDFATNLRNADNEEINYYFVQEGELNEKDRKGRYAHIYPFGMNDMAYCSDEPFLKRAKLINYLYCNSADNRFPDMAKLDEIPVETLWAEADKAWRGLKVAEKWSSRYSAYGLSCKLDSLRAMRGLDVDDTSQDLNPLTPSEIDCLAAVEHNRWNVERLLMGYRKARPQEDRYNYPAYKTEFNKNNRKKLYIHPDIRPYKDLDDIRQYDIEIVKYLSWILKMTKTKH